MKNLLLLFTFSLLLAACSRDTPIAHVQEEDTYHDQFIFDQHFVIDDKIPDFNEGLPMYLKTLEMEDPYIDNKKAQMGRILFYDKSLSADGKVSCASCHKSNLAFADNKTFSKGVEGHFTKRNSSPLGNVVNFSAHYRTIGDESSSPALLWDNRTAGLQEQIKIAIENPLEMGASLAEITKKVNQTDYYRFPIGHFLDKNEVLETDITECIAEFVSSIGASKSRLDEGLEIAQVALDAQDTSRYDTIINIIIVYYNGTKTMDTLIDTKLTEVFVPAIPTLDFNESLGRRLFVDNCTGCHSPIRPAQSVFAACNGLDMNYSDQGIGEVTGRAEDMGVFKSPSLRNIELTAPYMHDGRFETLMQVINFYSDGIQDHPNLHPTLKNKNGSLGLHFSDEEKNALLAFLKTMSDKSSMDKNHFQNPFKY